MIEIRQKITLDTLTKEDLVEALTRAWGAAGDVWASELLPKHFKPGAIAEYSYRSRSRSYTERKQRQFGHRRPLELTGRLRRSLEAGHRTEAKAQGSKRRGAVKIHMSGPSYVRRDLLKELRAISSRDERRLASALDAQLQRELDKPGTTRTQR